MSVKLPLRTAQLLSALTSLALVMGAYAADGHGGHGEADKLAKEAKAPKEAKDKEAKADKPVDKLAEKPAEKSLDKPSLPPAGSGSVSMSELRDMIDQKIAEVRAKREPAPVLHVRHSAGNARAAAPKPAAPAPAAAAHDERKPGVSGHDLHWAYIGDTGPESWGRLKPEFQTCMVGKRQSPIDIRDGIPVQMDPIQFDYRSSGFRVIDNGHTVQVNIEPGNSIQVNGRRYELLQFHFHRPSEERINGRQFDMVAHLVHKDMEGRLAVVAVLLSQQGAAHPVIQQVWNNLPLEKNQEQVAQSNIDLTLLLPEQRQYYTYMGSLTTPPCSEGVLWMVMKQPAIVSPDQVRVFGKLYPMNARPVQAASGRLIKDGQ